jgi:DNA-directed RNA polymerase subunit M/transcription elongation factor TFIIS
MLNKLTDKIECEVCGSMLELSKSDTIEDYAIAITTNNDNISKKIDEVISKYLVYKCPSCNTTYKYTYKDLEKVLRKSLTQKMLVLIARGSIINSTAITDKSFFYCGKCNGIDGVGGCLKTAYNSCEIKRFPLNGI